MYRHKPIQYPLHSTRQRLLREWKTLLCRIFALYDSREELCFRRDITVAAAIFACRFFMPLGKLGNVLSNIKKSGGLVFQDRLTWYYQLITFSVRWSKKSFSILQFMKPHLNTSFSGICRCFHHQSMRRSNTASFSFPGRSMILSVSVRQFIFAKVLLPSWR